MNWRKMINYKAQIKNFIKLFITYGILLFWRRLKFHKSICAPGKPLDFFSTNSWDAELFMQNIYSTIVNKGDYVIDIGASHGLHTLPLHELVGKSGKVIACDAILSNLEGIKSKLIHDNVLFYCAAVTKPDIVNINENIEFNYFPNLDGWSGIKRRPEIKEDQQCLIVNVPTITIEKIIQNLNLNKKTNISFIKIDVEGGDFDVLLGAEYILKKY